MTLTSFRVGTRLAAAFALLLLASGLLTAIGINATAITQRNLDSVVDHDYAAIKLVNKMMAAVSFQAVAVRDVVLQEDTHFKRTELNLMKEARKNFTSALAKVTTIATETHDDPLRNLLATVEAADNAMFEQINSAIDLSLDDKHQAAQELIASAVRPAQVKVNQDIDRVLAYLENLSNQAADSAAQSYRSALEQLTIFGAIVVLLGIAVGFIITRSIVTPLRDAVSVANAIADGDLTRRPVANGSDETAQLMHALSNMHASLARVLGDVQLAVDTVTTECDAMYRVVETVTTAVKEQTKRLASTSTSVEEITVTISSVYQGADDVLKAAESSRNVVRESEKTFADVTAASASISAKVESSSDAMHELAKAIEGVTAVTNVIREIAEQTNLLALNAAIEAARAGDQGRGFAVVADEVRVLSHRTAASTADIAKMVDGVKRKTAEVVASMHQVNAEVSRAGQLNTQASRSLSQIFQHADNVAHLAAEITAITEDQAKASESVAMDIHHIAATGEEIETQHHGLEDTAGHLKVTSDQLSEMTKLFKLA